MPLPSNPIRVMDVLRPYRDGRTQDPSPHNVLIVFQEINKLTESQT